MFNVSSRPSAVVHNAVRRRQFLYAVAASTASKIVALGVQLLAFPFALHSFGTDRYASFLALQSLLSWTGLCGLGLSLSLPKFVAAASVVRDRDEERNLVVTSLILLGTASLILLAFLVLLALMISPSVMVAAKSNVSVDELRVAYLIAALISAAQLFTSIEASIRAGYQEFHRASLCALIASIFFVLPGLFYVAGHEVSISAFIAIMYAPLICIFLVDIGLLFLQREYLRRGSVEIWKTARQIAVPSGNALAYQIEYALIVYLPTLIVAHTSSAGETAAFGSVLQLLALGGSSLNLFFQPMMSAVANAHSLGDVHWIERNYKRFFLLVGCVGAAILVSAATIGPFLVRHWLGASIPVSRGMLTAFGFYFFFLSISLLQFYVLSAMGALERTGWVYVLQGTLALALGTMLCPFWGGVGMVLGLAVGVALTSWILPLKVWSALKNLKARP